MKILLIAPYVDVTFEGSEEVDRIDFIPSSALLSLAAILRANNYEPIILDFNNVAVDKHKKNYSDYCKKIVIDNLNKHKPDLVGINCLFSGVFPAVLDLAKVVKSHSPDLKIVIGGMHPTTFAKDILTNCSDIDYVAIAEGELAMVSLAASVKEKNENLLSSIKSFGYKDKEGVVRINSEQNYVDDLDTLPIPAWDLINLDEFELNLDHYYNPRNLPIKHKAYIFTSRACPCVCNFCDLFMVMGRKHRKRSPKLVVDEIEMLHKSHGVNYFSFFDDNFTLNKAHVMAVCDEIIKRKLIIMADTPSGLWINSIREEILAKMTEAGFVKVALSIEHGDDYMRNEVIKKTLDRKKIFEVAEMIKKFPMMVTGQFIMGFPEDTNETLQKTYDMIEELEFDQSVVQQLIPLYGTPVYKQIMKDKDKDKLLIDSSNLNEKELWKTPLGQGQNQFIIKPYKMSVDDLYKWRQKFDKLEFKYWRQHMNKREKGLKMHNIELDSTGVFPRQTFGRVKSLERS